MFNDPPSGMPSAALRLHSDTIANMEPLRIYAFSQTGLQKSGPFEAVEIEVAGLWCAVDDGCTEYSLSGSVERQLGLRGSDRSEWVFPHGA